MIHIAHNIYLRDEDVELFAIRAQGAGGQNVNKVASAIHLRFDIAASSLPEHYKQRLLALRDNRVTKEGVVIIKAQRFRTQEKNREDALQRLRLLISEVLTVAKKRVPTKPTFSARNKRMDRKSKHGRTKTLRGKVSDNA